MNRRAFLKTSSAIVTSSAIASRVAGGQDAARTNWAGNHTYRAGTLHEPKTLEEVQETVRRCRTLKALGTRHSFNAIADSAENQISLAHLNRIHGIDETERTVTVDAGIRYGELCRHLHAKGYAVHNLASLPHISAGGACSTATHGSGDRNGNLASVVSAIELVTADGDVVTLSRQHDGDAFHGAVVGLGGLGVTTKLTLDVQPAFQVQQHVYQRLPLRQLEEHFDDIMSSGYSVSLFTDWQGPHINQVWVKRRVEQGASVDVPREWFGARLATRDLHPLEDHSAENCTPQMGRTGPWHERLPHFRLEFTPSSGKELQAEYFVPRRHAVEAILAIQGLADRLAPVLMISEVRSIAADELWTSPCYKQPSIAIHFTCKQDWPALRSVLPDIESRLEPFGVRPHWGKLFTIAPEMLRSRYPRAGDFLRLLERYDPHAKFRNAFLETHLYS